MEYLTGFARPEPYPEITEATDDPVAVREIRKNYCSSKSEAIAVLQYVYHHFVSNKFAKEAADVFMKIGKVEMKHLDILAEAMAQFGGDPLYMDQYGASMTCGWVNYARSLKDILTANINDEAGAVENYRASAQIVKNQSLKALFLRLAEDEELHLSILRRMLEREEYWK